MPRGRRPWSENEQGRDLSTSLSYPDSTALGDAGESVEGRILPGRKGETIRVRYTGDRTALVTYARVGEVYDPVDLPELPGC